MYKALFSSLMYLLFASMAWACSPAANHDDSDEANIAHASRIFVAHITSVNEIPSDATRARRAVATYRLVESIKGSVARTGKIETSYSTCHVALSPGGDYILFAQREQNGRLIALPGLVGTRQFLPGSDQSTTYLNTIKHHVTGKTTKTP
jgi:hypothetical protein